MPASAHSVPHVIAGGDAPRRRWRDGAFCRLVAADTKDLVRTLQTGFVSLFLFAFFLAVIFAIEVLFAMAATDARITVVSEDASFVSTIDSSLGDAVAASTPDAATIVVAEQNGHVELVIDAQANPDWHSVWRAVRGAGVAPADISVVDTDGVWRTDIVQQNLAPAIGMGLMAIAFVGAAVPLVSMRERGLLRLLGTTPVRTTTFVLALVPVRLVVAIAEIAAVLAIAAIRSYTDIGMLWRLGISLMLGFAMLLSIAFVLAARARNAANMQQWMVALTMALVGIGGGFVPPQTIPAPLQVFFDVVPTTWMIQAISADLTGATPAMSVYVLWALMTGCTVAALAIAARTFSWDREPGVRRSGRRDD